jgi:hypothetical protein
VGTTGVVATPDTKVFPTGLLDDVKSLSPTHDYSGVTFNMLCALSVLYPLRAQKTKDAEGKELKLREYHKTIEFGLIGCLIMHLILYSPCIVQVVAHDEIGYICFRSAQFQSINIRGFQ